MYWDKEYDDEAAHAILCASGFATHIRGRGWGEKDLAREDGKRAVV